MLCVTSVSGFQVKAKLPRRESERRNHPLARHVDILSAIETRLSLLSMTYSKYIDLGLCCFIPGKVIVHLPVLTMTLTGNCCSMQSIAIGALLSPGAAVRLMTERM